jgi:hypothetical protein
MRLAAIVANRNSPQKHVWRVRIILLTADGLVTAEIMRRTGEGKSVVWRWQGNSSALIVLMNAPLHLLGRSSGAI